MRPPCPCPSASLVTAWITLTPALSPQASLFCPGFPCDSPVHHDLITGSSLAKPGFSHPSPDDSGLPEDMTSLFSFGLVLRVALRFGTLWFHFGEGWLCLQQPCVWCLLASFGLCTSSQSWAILISSLFRAASLSSHFSKPLQN